MRKMINPLREMEPSEAFRVVRRSQGQGPIREAFRKSGDERNMRAGETVWRKLIEVYHKRWQDPTRGATGIRKAGMTDEK
jgi:hypothetical protein